MMCSQACFLDHLTKAICKEARASVELQATSLGHRLEDCWLFPGHDTTPVKPALLFGLRALQ